MRKPIIAGTLATLLLNTPVIGQENHGSIDVPVNSGIELPINSSNFFLSRDPWNEGEDIYYISLGDTTENVFDNDQVIFVRPIEGLSSRKSPCESGWDSYTPKENKGYLRQDFEKGCLEEHTEYEAIIMFLDYVHQKVGKKVRVFRLYNDGDILFRFDYRYQGNKNFYDRMLSQLRQE